MRDPKPGWFRIESEGEYLLDAKDDERVCEELAEFLLRKVGRLQEDREARDR